MISTLAVSALLVAGSQTTIDVKVTIDSTKPMATMQPDALGVGVAVWDAHMVDQAIPKLLKDVGYRVIRYPGGSYADIYHWKTGTTTKGIQGTIKPNTEFDSFMGMCQKAASTTLITVNYGTNEEGTGGAEPREAAEWVRYANKTKKYGVKYWEIGNEVYGNGFYNGKGWEADLHAPDTGKSEDRLKNPKLGPVAYGENVNAFIKAMKVEDPTIKVGAVLCTPGGWPDGVDPDWNSNVLKTCGANIDFVVIHWYGEGKSASEVLASTSQIPKIMSSLKETVRKYCGDRADQIQLWMTEGDGSTINMRHAGALFAADFYSQWFANGASTVVWWNLHNGLSVDRNGIFDDQGMLSSGHSERGVQQPDANTPFPAYWGQYMFGQFAKPGDQFLPTTSSRPELIVHAVKRGNGVRALLINRDPDHVMRVSGVRGARELGYGRTGRGKWSALAGSELRIGPEEIVVVELN
ncbi:MAG: hypothetical protein BGO01_05950 [Armatimonadetes bacterium 55-13]|nr:hypothetical protein [Armatimonadota bacterium]OJU61610.1 MAG: hypothetical protein BGO01_05950 [Armatimonadetes bacterium 55-13]